MHIRFSPSNSLSDVEIRSFDHSRFDPHNDLRRNIQFDIQNDSRRDTRFNPKNDGRRDIRFNSQNDLRHNYQFDCQNDLRQGLLFDKHTAYSYGELSDTSRKRQRSDELPLPQSKRPYYAESKTFIASEYRRSLNRNEPYVIELPSAHQAPYHLDRPATIAFNGQYASDYAYFSNYINKKDEYSEKDFASLGAVSKKMDYYFDETKSIKQIAIKFLSEFWNNEYNRNATMELHWGKCNARQDNEPQHPGCISFVHVKIHNKNYCFVSISGLNIKFDVAKIVSKYIDESNRDKKNDDIEFLFIVGNTGNFSNLLADVSGKTTEVNTKKCSEKYYASTLMKFYAEHGHNMTVIGAVTYSFYPFRADKTYGNQPNSSDITVKYRDDDKSNLTILPKNLLLVKLPCCQPCKENKNAIMKALKTAQDDGQMLLSRANASMENDKTYLTSPPHKSIKSNSSLVQLNTQGLFARRNVQDSAIKTTTSSISRNQHTSMSKFK